MIEAGQRRLGGDRGFGLAPQPRPDGIESVEPGRGIA
jgi:hypothetical protein